MPGGALVRSVQARMRPAWRKAMLSRATDVTSECSSRSCLVVAPHPDDETLGCGATIARKLAHGTEVHVVVAADGRSSHTSDVISKDQLVRMRADEVRQATARLGLPPERLTLLCLPDETVASRHEELVQRLHDLVVDHRPADVLVTSALDWHPDHAAVNAAAREALARCGPGRPRMLEYPIWYWVEGPWLRRTPSSLLGKASGLLRDPVRSFVGRDLEVVRVEEHLATKRHALASYRTQLTNVTGEESWAVLGDPFVEAFLGGAEVFFATPGS